MTINEEYKKFICDVIEKQGGIVSVERDSEGAVESDTVSIWSETECCFIEMTDIYVSNGCIFAKGFDNRDRFLQNLPVDDFEVIESFLTLYVDGFDGFTPSPSVIQGNILNGYKEYQNKLNKEVSRLLEICKTDLLVSDSGKTLYLTNNNACVIYPDKTVSFEVHHIIELLNEIKL